MGKSHLEQAVGISACLKGSDVLYRNTIEMLDWLHAGRAEGSYRRRLRQLCTTDILILNDFGLQVLSTEAQNDLFQIILARYERCPIIITSNRDFAEWPTVFDNPLLGSAVMDRLVHRAIKLVIEGKSYRLWHLHDEHRVIDCRYPAGVVLNCVAVGFCAVFSF